MVSSVFFTVLLPLRLYSHLFYTPELSSAKQSTLSQHQVHSPGVISKSHSLLLPLNFMHLTSNCTIAEAPFFLSSSETCKGEGILELPVTLFSAFLQKASHMSRDGQAVWPSILCPPFLFYDDETVHNQTFFITLYLPNTTSPPPSHLNRPQSQLKPQSGSDHSCHKVRRKHK